MLYYLNVDLIKKVIVLQQEQRLQEPKLQSTELNRNYLHFKIR